MSEGKSPHQPPPGAGASSTALDRALAEWPIARSLSAAAEKAAERVLGQLDSHVTRVGVGVADEDLLGAPLPAAASEAALERGALAPMSRERDRTSLKDLARLAGPPAPSSSSFSGAIFGTPLPNPESEPEIREENSGMINLAALAAGDAGPASTVPPSTVGTSRSTSRPVYDREVMSTLRSADAKALGFPAPTVPPTRPALNERRERRSWIVAGGVVAAAAVAAGLFVGFRSAPGVAGAPVAVVPQASPAATASPKRAAGGAARPVTAPVATADQAVDPLTLPQVDATGNGATAARPATAISGHATATVTASAAASSAAAAPSAVAPAPPAPSSPAPAVTDQSLEALMQQAAGPTATPAAAATATGDAPPIAPGSVPLKPSQGAIQGALGAALPAARACLDADDPVSHATVTFKSDGSVQSVSISGGASGKPAEGCVRGALMKARVTPFAQPTFTSSTTVRPN